MEIYVAARFGRKEEVKKVQKELRDMGHHITFDWTTHPSIQPYDQNRIIALQFAQEDVAGVVNSDIFIQLIDAIPSTGVHVELGLAIMSWMEYQSPTIYVVGHDYPSLFHFHPAVHRMTDIDQVYNRIKLNE